MSDDATRIKHLLSRISELEKSDILIRELLEMFNDSGQFMTGHRPMDWAKFLQKARRLMTPNAALTGERTEEK